MGFLKKKNHDNFYTNPNFMDGLYIFHDELGSGGFGKVKLATHILTGEKVAVKIIDKKAIGDDLPRVTSELEALQRLQHQNICRLFQFAETEEKFYIVMEYCNGGEMFDYIVKKERLEESEARHFFRQLVQAMAYVHSLGFAHRDLKPENLLLNEDLKLKENLLLKEDLQLKVIDFGLCAKPRNGLNHPLKTCCGSPAYAAPELIQNSAYFGNETDVWSMGVLLYALLCGALPFEDESMPKLYRKIMNGVYHEPAFLSQQSKELLREMLKVNPKYRITLKQLLVHPWLNKNYSQQLKWNTIYDKNIIDEEIAKELAFFRTTSLIKMVELLKEWKFDYLTATYLILLQRKERKQNYSLPLYRKRCGNIINSPTIHASLELNLNLSGQDSHEDEEFNGDNDYCQNSSLDKSYANAIAFGSPSVYTNNYQNNKVPLRELNASPGASIRVLHTSADTPLHNVAKREKENLNMAACNRYRIPGFNEVPQTSTAPNNWSSVYNTPRRAPIAVPPTTVFSPVMYRRPQSTERETVCKNHSLETTPIKSPSTEDVSGTERIPRSQLKTPNRLRQRVFKSLERKADKMINLLTPKKVKSEGPTRLKCIKTMVNVSSTSSTDPYQVRTELVRVLVNLGIEPIQNGWKISGSKRNAIGDGQTTVELEVVLIESLNYVGVKRRRLNGDAFLYKKVCEEVLRLSGL